MFPVSRKVSLFVTFLILVLCAYFIGSSLLRNQRAFELMTERDKTRLQGLVTDIPKRFIDILRNANSGILSDKEISEAFYEQDKAKTAQLLEQYFSHLRGDFGNTRTVIHLLLADGTSFYRAHQPDQFGDNLLASRPMIKKTLETGEEQSGFETGRYGLSLRVISPVYRDGELIGALDTAIDAGFIAARISSLTSYAASILLNMQSSDHYKMKINNKVSSDKFEIFNTSPELFEKIYGKLNGSGFPELLKVDGRIFFLISDMQITEFSGENTGIFLFALDVTEEIKWVRAYLYKSAAATAFIVILILFIIRKGFREMIGGLERKYARTIKELERKEAQCRGYIVNAPLAVFVTDSNLNLLETNPAAEELTGYSDPEMMLMNFISLFHYESPETKEAIRKSLTETGRLSGMYTFRTANGKRIQVQADAASLPSHRLNIIFCRDVTEENSLKIDLERAYAELEDMNRHLTVKVEEEIEKRQKTEKHLEQQKKFSDMGQMINAIAHQWRQPLNALGIYIQDTAERIKEKVLTEKDLSEFESVSMMLISQMSDTIDNFRSFFLPSKEQEKFNVAEETAYLLRMLSAQMSSKNINLTYTCDCDGEKRSCMDDYSMPVCGAAYVSAFGYVGEFRQALMNIVSNAIYAVEEKSLTEKKLKGMINIELSCYNGIIKLNVKDNGTGIANETLSKVFDPYYTTKPQGRGTGIGLYVTKLLIEKHMGGKIRIYNNPEGGAGVEITLSQDIADE
ncbi:PAS domain S-box protein [Geovibrio thiophilus]|uniref:histidine kinase n=1 Tax=Geovibrio thiophilus TaxID=139438 RepID=A0A410K1U2_9BACT|nr:ATP-binding protein [Geovibrio thiophilus]QAR34410.1 PAS domain S-box protein [Geovibrio thiophilus]